MHNDASISLDDHLNIIKFHLLPGLMVDILRTNAFSINIVATNRTSQSSRDESSSPRSKKNYSYYLQIALPFTVLPFVLFSSVLPFIIPVLKLGMIFAATINNAALLASIMYVIRQIAFENEQKQAVYFNPGYN